MPDEGTIEWNKNVRVGYLDQHSVLSAGMTIRDVLKSAFNFLFEIEEKINEIYCNMGEASEDEMADMMEEVGTLQDLLESHDFYNIDPKVEEVGLISLCIIGSRFIHLLRTNSNAFLFIAE